MEPRTFEATTLQSGDSRFVQSEGSFTLNIIDKIWIYFYTFQNKFPHFHTFPLGPALTTPVKMKNKAWSVVQEL